MAQSFDEGQLMSRVDGDLGFLAETVQMLETDGPALLADIDRAFAAGDAQALARAAHALKGMISNFCADPAQQSALELERVGKSGNLASAADAVAVAEQRLHALIAELQSFVHARS